MTQADLFAEPLLAGLDYRPEFITADEEGELLGHLQTMDLAPFRFQGWTGNRKTQSFGWRYDFDDATFQPAEPVPAWLAPLRAQGCRVCRPTTSRTRWWRVTIPAPESAGTRTGACSTRSSACPCFHPPSCGFDSVHLRRFTRFNLRVEPRSAYRLSGEARYEWEHRIVPGDDLRFSITFRTMSDLGRKKAAEAQRIS